MTTPAETRPEVQTERVAIDGAMEILGIERAALYARIKEGALKPEKTDHQLFFPRAEVEALRDKLADETQERVAELKTWLETLAAGADPEAEPPADDAAPPALVAEMGTRLLRLGFTDNVQEIYVDPVVDGDRIVFRHDGRHDDRGRLTAKLATDLKKWLKDRSTTALDAHGAGQSIGQIEIDGRRHQYRVNVVPTRMGEHLQLRLFPAQESLSALGFDEAQVAALQHALAAGSGLILLADAADAWSERHRRALSQELSNAGRLVVCLERRLQFRSELLVQLDVAPEEGKPAFADLWRSALAMDPDVLVIDELKDAEAARLAVDAAGGGLVVAQVMAADADAARRKLLKWEVDAEALDATLLATVERIHVRTLCPSCRQSRSVTGEGVATVYAAVGCDACTDGYLGVHPVCGIRLFDGGDESLGLEAQLRAAVESGATADGMARLRPAPEEAT